MTVERHFGQSVTLDCCGHKGVQIIRPNGNSIRYCSRYKDENNSYLNYLNLPFDELKNEVCWIFPPRAQMSTFAHYYLLHRPRPAAYFVVLQHAERPGVLELLLAKAVQHRIYTGSHILRRPVSNRQAFSRYAFAGRLHVVLLPAQPS